MHRFTTESRIPRPLKCDVQLLGAGVLHGDLLLLLFTMIPILNALWNTPFGESSGSATGWQRETARKGSPCATEALGWAEGAMGSETRGSTGAECVRDVKPF